MRPFVELRHHGDAAVYKNTLDRPGPRASATDKLEWVMRPGVLWSMVWLILTLILTLTLTLKRSTDRSTDRSVPKHEPRHGWKCIEARTEALLRHIDVLRYALVRGLANPNNIPNVNPNPKTMHRPKYGPKRTKTRTKAWMEVYRSTDLSTASAY